MKHFLSILVLIIFVATASAAERDGDKKHKCSKERKAKILAQFDADNDGKLSESERATAKAGMQERRAARIEKLKTEKPEIFARIDKNSDGTIDREEFKAARAQRKNHKCDKGKDGAKRERGNKGERSGRRANKE